MRLVFNTQGGGFFKLNIHDVVGAGWLGHNLAVWEVKGGGDQKTITILP